MRRRSFALIGVIGGLSVASIACSTSSGGAASDDSTDAADRSSASVDDDGTGAYLAFMAELCATTDERVATLPSPPDQIRADLWATEVATAFATEADRSDRDARPPDDLRLAHRTYVETTAELVDAWTALASSLAAGAADVEERRTDVTQLALGRDATARELGLAACDRSGS